MKRNKRNIVNEINEPERIEIKVEPLFPIIPWDEIEPVTWEIELVTWELEPVKWEIEPVKWEIGINTWDNVEFISWDDVEL